MEGAETSGTTEEVAAWLSLCKLNSWKMIRVSFQGEARIERCSFKRIVTTPLARKRFAGKWNWIFYPIIYLLGLLDVLFPIFHDQRIKNTHSIDGVSLLFIFRDPAWQWMLKHYWSVLQDLTNYGSDLRGRHCSFAAETDEIFKTSAGCNKIAQRSYNISGKICRLSKMFQLLLPQTLKIF